MTTQHTPTQIGEAAELSIFYVTPDGTWLRINWTDTETQKFSAFDEESYEEYEIEFSSVTEENPHFEMLTRYTFIGEES